MGSADLNRVEPRPAAATGLPIIPPRRPREARELSDPAQPACRRAILAVLGAGVLLAGCGRRGDPQLPDKQKPGGQ